MVNLPATRPPTSNVFTINGKRFPLATIEQARELNRKRAWQFVEATKSGQPLAQPFRIDFSSFHEGYGYTFGGAGAAVYEVAKGFDLSAVGKARTWGPLATSAAITDIPYPGWIYQDFTTGYVYLMRGRYAVKYQPDATLGSEWPILEYHVFGASGMVVAGEPALFAGDVYVPLITAATGVVERWQRLSTVAVPNSEVQTIVISGTPSAGTYTISFPDGVTTYTTAALAYDAGQAAVQAALRLLPGLAQVTVVTTGSTPNFTHTVTLTAAPTAFGASSPPQFTSTMDGAMSGSGGSIAHATTTPGTGDQWDRGPVNEEAQCFTVWNKANVGAVLVRAKANMVSMASTAPLVEANWSTEQEGGDSTFIINALATLGRLLYLMRPDGVKSFDETGLVQDEIPDISNIIDSRNGVGTVAANRHLLIPHKIGLIRFNREHWAVVGAEEDYRLEGEQTAGGWGRVIGLAPYGRTTYATITDGYGGVSSLISLTASAGEGKRGPLTPHMHQQDELPLEDAAILTLRTAPTVPLNLTTLSDDAAVGANAWSDPENAQLGDGLYATASAVGQTHYLKALGLLGTDIPSTATVTGITVEVARKTTPSNIMGSLTLPGTGANLASVGTNAWTNPGNITADDATYATCATAGVTQGLRASNFGFAIPTNAQVLGVQLAVDRHAVEGTGPTPATAANAGTCANDAAVGSTGWANLTNATGAPGVDSAEASFNTSGTQYLKATNFGIVIPGSGNTILGVAARIKKSVIANAGSHTDNAVRLVKAGTAQGTNNASGAWPTGTYSDTTYVSYGSSSDMWGLTLTQADVEASDFGIAISGISTVSTTGYVSGFEITVYYQTTAGVYDSVVKLVDASGAVVGTSKASASAWPTSDAVATYGAADDVWGATLTPAVVNDADFGAIVSATIPTSGQALVDYFKIAVTYQIADVVDTVVRLVKAGAVVGSNLADTSTLWPGVDAYVTYGGTANLWGTTWTAAEVNAADFGVVVSATVVGGVASVGHVRITVAYTVQGANDPASYLAVIKTTADQTEAHLEVYQLPRAGQPPSNDPFIDGHVSIEAELRTARRYDPSRTDMKLYSEGTVYLEIDPEGASTPGVQLQAQLDDDGEWMPLVDEHGQSTFYRSGARHLYLPGGSQFGRWVQLRPYIPELVAPQVPISVVVRDLELSGYVMDEPADLVQCTIVLRPGALYEDGQIERRTALQMREDIRALVEPDPQSKSRRPLIVHDPVFNRDVRMVVVGWNVEENRFRSMQESDYVVTLQLKNILGGRP